MEAIYFFATCNIHQNKAQPSSFISLKALSVLRLIATRATAEWIARTEAMLAVNAILLAISIMH